MAEGGKGGEGAGEGGLQLGLPCKRKGCGLGLDPASCWTCPWG